MSPACSALLSTTAPMRHPAARLPRRTLVPSNVVAIPLEDAAVLKPEDRWVATVDLEAFRKDVDELGTRLAAQQGSADISHLKKMILWSNACGAVGLGTMWLPANP